MAVDLEGAGVDGFAEDTRGVRVAANRLFGDWGRVKVKVANAADGADAYDSRLVGRKLNEILKLCTLWYYVSANLKIADNPAILQGRCIPVLCIYSYMKKIVKVIKTSRQYE